MDVVVAQVPIPDTTMVAELFLLDTAGSDLYKESLAQVGCHRRDQAPLCVSEAPLVQ